MSIEPISRAELAERRRRFQAQLGEGVAMIPGAKSRTRSHDTDYLVPAGLGPLYLTGLRAARGGRGLHAATASCSSCSRATPLLETWNGRRPGIEGAVTRFGADEAHPIGELAREAAGPAREPAAALCHTFGARPGARRRWSWRRSRDVRARVRRGVTAPSEIVSPHALCTRCGCASRARELEIMRAAAAISREAHHAAAHASRSRARTSTSSRPRSCTCSASAAARAPAYNPIVGTGDNATILHYVENKRRARRPGELVLIDAGVELHGYASDVTRTLSGRRALRGRGARRVPGRARRAGGGVRARSRRASRCPQMHAGGAAPARRWGWSRSARSRATSTS